MLSIFDGLPGTGKLVLARYLAPAGQIQAGSSLPEISPLYHLVVRHS